ncbi:MAG: formylglycine-generating enzyme family protein [Treponema sp.]|jgi:formylglycine-generating enzyme required for sulfatase activity|nr:formylglycine-generating enzyme family protein [Treponema sp.]
MKIIHRNQTRSWLLMLVGWLATLTVHPLVAQNRDGAQRSNPSPAGIPAVGSLTITSERAGMIMIDGVETEDQIKAMGTVTIPNVRSGVTEVAVKEASGRITKAPQTVLVRAGETVQVVVRWPIPDDFVQIQGGTFTMGSPDAELHRENDEIPHQVTVGSFYMGKYEVTQQEYDAMMGGNPSRFKGDRLPVEQVSWFDAVAYCNVRSQKEGLTPAYSINGEKVTWNPHADGYRLPTEAEWEYAARGGTTTPFSTGNDITTSQANYNGNYPYNQNTPGIYREKTTPVGSFAPNPWGLYDMHGNVNEWCWDWYGPYSTESQDNPWGASTGSSRVNRGGSWSSYAKYLRSAIRNYNMPSYRYGNRGFRLVRSGVL